MERLERVFERALWGSRLIILIGVVGGVLLALGATYMATLDVFRVLLDLGSYSRGALDVAERAELRDATVTGIVKAIDGYLIAGILLIVALGLYELFINRIDPALRSEAAPRLLRVRSLDDLKDRLAKLILLILAIEFFQRALRLTYDNALDLLYLALGILLIGAAFALSSVKLSSGSRDDDAAS